MIYGPLSALSQVEMPESRLGFGFSEDLSCRVAGFPVPQGHSPSCSSAFLCLCGCELHTSSLGQTAAEPGDVRLWSLTHQLSPQVGLGKVRVALRCVPLFWPGRDQGQQDLRVPWLSPQLGCPVAWAGCDHLGSPHPPRAQEGTRWGWQGPLTASP